jgi:hypothetical protein
MSMPAPMTPPAITLPKAIALVEDFTAIEPAGWPAASQATVMSL